MVNTVAFRYGLILFIVVILAAGYFWLGLTVDPLYSWLAAVNLVTFLTYGYDKMIAGSSIMRVPEKVLLILALAGGTIGALLGMYIFRHKTSKQEFKNKFLLVLLIQAVLIAAYYFFT